MKATCDALCKSSSSKGECIELHVKDCMKLGCACVWYEETSVGERETARRLLILCPTSFFLHYICMDVIYLAGWLSYHLIFPKIRCS